MLGKRGLFLYSTIGKFPKNARGKGSSCIALPEIHKCQKKEASSPDSTTGKFPAAAIPWQQGIVYSDGGAPTHRFNCF